MLSFSRFFLTNLTSEWGQQPPPNSWMHASNVFLRPARDIFGGSEVTVSSAGLIVEDRQRTDTGDLTQAIVSSVSLIAGVPLGTLARVLALFERDTLKCLNNLTARDSIEGRAEGAYHEYLGLCSSRQKTEQLYPVFQAIIYLSGEAMSLLEHESSGDKEKKKVLMSVSKVFYSTIIAMPCIAYREVRSIEPAAFFIDGTEAWLMRQDYNNLVESFNRAIGSDLMKKDTHLNDSQKIEESLKRCEAAFSSNEWTSYRSLPL